MGATTLGRRLPPPFSPVLQSLSLLRAQAKAEERRETLCRATTEVDEEGGRNNVALPRDTRSDGLGIPQRRTWRRINPPRNFS